MQLIKFINPVILIFVLSILFFASCEVKKIPESCLENLLGKSLDSILRDSTISLMNIDSTSSNYYFLFGVKSHLPEVFFENEIEGAPTMVVHTSENLIQEIEFRFTSIGDTETSHEIINDVLLNHFCIEKKIGKEGKKTNISMYLQKWQNTH